MVAKLEAKQKLINRLLLDEYALVHLDPKTAGVTLPDHLMQNEYVTLKLSRLFRGAMQVLDGEIVAELLFDDEYFNCNVPFAAIWGMTSVHGENFIWDENAPELALNGGAKDSSAKLSKERKKSTHLKRVK